MTEMKIHAGTIVGPHHKKQGEGNQDAFAYIQENGYTIIACADGAGSLKNSGVGASIAAATSVEEVLDALIIGNSMEEALHKGVERARDAVMSREDWDTLGCTLSVAVYANDQWGVALVGDSFAVISPEKDDHLLLHRESDSEYANITKLLTSSNYDPMFVYGNGPVVAMSVASDGLTNLSIDLKDKQPTNAFWNPVVSRCADHELDIQSFLFHMDDKEKLYDDTTLVVATTV